MKEEVSWQRRVIMAERLKVVVRRLDGKLQKGVTLDFSPAKPAFHLASPAAAPRDVGAEVQLRDLKAVFFVKCFDGQRTRTKGNTFKDGARPTGRKVRVKFSDGEVLVGSTMGYDQKRQGFFVFPADEGSNNLKAFVVTSAVQQVSFI